MQKIRILIADDHTIMRIGLTTLISSERDMDIVGEADNGEAAVDLARKLKPDVVIMDLMMPVLSGAEAIKIIRAEMPSVKVVVLTTFGQSADLAMAVRYGANATLLKDMETGDVTKAIRAVHAGQTIIPKKILELADEAALPAMTVRQKKILEAVVRGLSNNDIANLFGISEIGVKKHIQAICQKLGAANRTEAASIALSRQML